MHVKIRSLNGQWDELCMLLNNSEVPNAAIVLKEVIKETPRQTLYHRPGYSQYAPCEDNLKEDGVFVKDVWLPSRVNATFDHAEAVAVSLTKGNINCTIFATYRPLNQNVKLFLDNYTTFFNDI